MKQCEWSKQSYSHQEYNREPYTNLDHIKQCIENGKDFISQASFVESKEFIPPIFKHFFGLLNT